MSREIPSAVTSDVPAAAAPGRVRAGGFGPAWGWLAAAAFLAAVAVAAPLSAALAGLAAGLAFLAVRHIAARRETARIHAEREAELVARNAALVEDAARLREIVERRGDIVYCLDGTDRVTYANEAYLAAFGRGDGDGARAPVRHAVEDAPEGVTPDVELRTLEGPRWYALDEHVRRDEAGRAVETHVVGRDVTARHEAESQSRQARAGAEAAEKAKSRLLTAVTHEVRTPIGGIMGMMDLLLDTELQPVQQSYAEAVRGSASGLLGLIDDLLDHAALEAGRLAVVERPYSLASVTQEVCELMGPRAEEKGLALALFVARKLPSELIGDPARVRQVLLNLVGNAIKFTEHGGVLVEVRPHRSAIEIVVRDTGRGIAAPDQARIFGEFERLGETASIAGSGLGLSISRRLVEAMGGALDLSSRRGRGSVFSVSLPRREGPSAGVPPKAALLDRRILVASASPVTRRAVSLSLRDEGARVASFARPRRIGAAIANGAGRDGVIVDLPMLPRLEGVLPPEMVVVLLSPSEREALPELRRQGTAYLIKPVRRASLLERLSGGKPGTCEDEPMAAAGRRVLVAEDDEVTALILRSLIEKAGHSAERVENGHEVIARTARDGFDLALVDINMPGMGGTAAAAAIRNREARLGGPRLRILAMSAGLSDGEAAAATAAGIDAVLRKPVRAEDLAAWLEPGEAAAGNPRRGSELSQIL